MFRSFSVHTILFFIEFVQQWLVIQRFWKINYNSYIVVVSCLYLLLLPKKTLIRTPLLRSSNNGLQMKRQHNEHFYHICSSNSSNVSHLTMWLTTHTHTPMEEPAVTPDLPFHPVSYLPELEGNIPLTLDRYHSKQIFTVVLWCSVQYWDVPSLFSEEEEKIDR